MMILHMPTSRDNVAWDEEQQEAATKAIEKQRSAPIDPEEQGAHVVLPLTNTSPSLTSVPCFPASFVVSQFLAGFSS